MNHKTRPLTLLLLAPLLLASGCSPHPATGTWTAAQAESGFNRLQVTYEGRANLFAVGEKEAGRHCFWGGESAQAITMVCKPAANKESEERYRLVVKDGSATLLQEDKALVSFTRQLQPAS